MFCGNCGTKVEDGALFCPNCGTRLGASAPVQETVAQVAETAAPIQQEVTQTVREAAAPVQETVTQAAEPVTAIPPMPEMPKMPEMPAQNVQTSAPAFQQAPVANGFDSGAAAAAPVTPIKKKKSKAGLIAGITAGAVVVGGAGVGYFGFHDKLTRLVMGDAKYAQMIDANAFKAIMPESVDAGEVSSKGLTSGLDAAMASQAAKIKGESGYGAYIDILKNAFGAGSGDYKDSIDKVFDNVPEGTMITMTSQIKLETGSMLAAVTGGKVGEIIGKVSDLRYLFSAANGDSDMISFSISDNDGEIGAVQVFCEESGDIVIALPQVTDKVIRLPKETLDKYLSGNKEDTQTGEKSDAPEFDEAEGKRIRQSIADIYMKHIENGAQIKYTDNAEFTVSGIGEDESVKGTDLTITFTGEEIKAVMEEIQDLLKSDEYLLSYASEKYGLTAEQYREIYSEVKEINSTVGITHIIDLHNNVLGTRILVTDTKNDSTADVSYIGRDKNVRAKLTFSGKDNNTSSLIFSNETSDGKSGTAEVKLTMDKQGAEFAFKAVYENVGTAKWNDRDVAVGKYTVTLSDPDKFVDSVKAVANSGVNLPGSVGGGYDYGDYNFNGDSTEYSEGMSNDLLGKTMSAQDGGLFGIDTGKIIDELKKFEMISETTVNDSTYRSAFSISLGDIGSFSASADTVKDTASVTLPDKSKEVNINDDKVGDELSAEALQWVGKLTERIGLGDIGSLLGGGIGNIGGNDEDAAKKQHYAAYDRYESTYYADDCAEKIYEALDGQVKEALKKSGSPDNGVIKMYYSEDGSHEVLTNAGITGIDYADDEIRNVYVEITFDKRVSDGIAGVTTVLTDDYNDLPAMTPDILNIYDRAFPWDDYSNETDNFILGTYPTLYYGEPTTIGIPEKEAGLDELNETAKKISESVSSFLGTSNRLNSAPTGAENIIQIGVSDGKATVYYSEYTTIDEELGNKLAEVVGGACDQDKVLVGLYFCDNIFVGTSVIFDTESISTYLTMDSMPTAGDFREGSFDGWTGAWDTDYEVAPGYVYNKDYETIIVGTYSLAADGVLEIRGGNGGEAFDGSIIGTWQFYDQYGDFLINGIDPNDVNMTVDIGEDTVTFNADGEEMLTVYYTDSIYFPGEYDIYITREDMESETAPAGNMAMYKAPVYVSILLMDGEEMTFYEFRKERGGPEGEIAFGAVMQLPDLPDIVGEWALSEDYYSIVISSNGVMGSYGNTEQILLLNPRDDGFDIYSDGEVTGRIQYSAETDTIYVEDFLNDESVVLRRVGYIEGAAYMGRWELYSLNDIMMEEYAKKLGRPVEDLLSYLDISEYDMLITNSETSEIHLLEIGDEGFVICDPGENTFEYAEYNADDDTITITSSIYKDAQDTDPKVSILVYKRAQ